MSESLPGRPPSGPSSSPAIEQEARADRVVAPQPRDQLARGIGLVGESDLDVLGVARHAWIIETGVARRLPRDLDDLGQPAEFRGGEPRFDRGQQSVDLRLRRVGPLGQRDQVDLAPVQALGHDFGRETTCRQPFDRECRRTVERIVLGIGGLTAVQEAGPVTVDLVDLRATVDREQEPARPSGRAREVDHRRSGRGCR